MDAERDIEYAEELARFMRDLVGPEGYRRIGAKVWAKADLVRVYFTVDGDDAGYVQVRGEAIERYWFERPYYRYLKGAFERWGGGLPRRA